MMYSFSISPLSWSRDCKWKLLLFCLFFSSAIFAQDAADNKRHKIGLAVGVSSGLHALVGVDAAATILPSLGVRVGYNHLKYTQNEAYGRSFNKINIGLANTAFLTDTEIDLSTTQFLLEFMPGDLKMFRISGGIAVPATDRFSATGSYSDIFPSSTSTVDPTEMGEVTVTYTTRKVFPYLGLGFGYAVPEKLLSFSLEAGAFYRGEPNITVVGSDVFESNNTAENQAFLEDDASKYKIHPVLALRIGVRLIGSK